MPTIRSILADKRALFWINADDTVSQAAHTMVEHNVGALPVLEEGRLVGVFSERDLMKKVIVESKNPEMVLVSDVMSTQLVTADINDDHQTCLQKMNTAKCRHLPIIEGNTLVAFLSARDLMKAEVEGKDSEIQVLKDMIYYVPPGQ